MGKRGVSAIVATVLLILISVAAVGIVWGMVVPLINGQIDKETLCLDVTGQVVINDDEKYTCWNNASGFKNVSLGVVRGAKDFVLADIQVLVFVEGDSESFSIVDAATTISPSDVTSEDLPRVNEEKVYVIDASGVFGDVDIIKIAPIVSNGNSQEVCDVSSMLKIKKCLV